ncbi:MAG: efflux RND transporter periplasmic adaptor subunit [Pseudomonadota bacterium]
MIGVLVTGGATNWYFMRGAITPANAAVPATPPVKVTKGRAADEPVTVNVVTAVKQNVPITLLANGTVVPLSTVEIRPQTSNILKTVHIKEGQFVRAGQVLFTLDDRSDRAILDKVLAQVARDQATLADLERQYKRSQDLVARKFIAQSAADTLQAQVEAQQALINSDHASVQSARIAISYATIVAPMAGRIGAINVASGSLVQPATVLASLTQINPIAVSFNVPESSLQGLLDAQRRGGVAVKTRLVNPERTLEGKLSFIDNAVDPVAGTIRVKAQFDNRDTALWPGQYVNTQIAVNTLKEAVVVPLAAIVTGTSGKFVYAVQDDKTAKAYPVGLIHAFGTSAVVSGLSGGEKVVVEGKQNLRAGSKVQEAQQLADASGDGRKTSPKNDSANKGDAQ